MTSLVASEETIGRFVKESLYLARRKNIDPSRLLREIAQWYGVLTPTGDNRWQFIHRSIHDYLAADAWRDIGNFRPERVREWNYRAAYVMCLSGDATDGMVRALRDTLNIQAFSECL
jgi:hypothetical protein